MRVAKEDALAGQNRLVTQHEIAAITQADDEHGDRTGTDQVGDDVDLQHARTLQRDDDDREDDQHDRGPDPPEAKLVAEQVVAAGRDHGGLETVKGGGAERDGHDEHDADDPAGKLFEEEEEGDAS